MSTSNGGVVPARNGCFRCWGCWRPFMGAGSHHANKTGEHRAVFYCRRCNKTQPRIEIGFNPQHPLPICPNCEGPRPLTKRLCWDCQHIRNTVRSQVPWRE